MRRAFWVIEGNMASVVIRSLSFSKNAKVLLSPIKLATVPGRNKTVEVTNYGEAVTHTGQVNSCLSITALP